MTGEEEFGAIQRKATFELRKALSGPVSTGRTDNDAPEEESKAPGV